MKQFIKAAAFFLLLAILFSEVQSVFLVNSDNYYLYQVMRAYEKEPEVMDAVYIGASNVFPFWHASLGWEEYGITVYPFATSAAPSVSLRYFAEEARKSHPDALFIFNLGEFKNEGVNVSAAHRAADYMPFSPTKVRLINAIAELNDFNELDKLEYYFPIIRFHSRWDDTSSSDYLYRTKELHKGNYVANTHLSKITDITDKFVESDQQTEISEKRLLVLDDLLDYCAREKLRVLFVTSPQALGTERMVGLRNAVCSYVEERGYDVLNLTTAMDELGLDLTTDFYNANHTNIHGSLKFTHWFGAYLQERYGLADKRGDPAYASWDEAAAEYEKTISPYTLDFEREHARRDNTLDKPELAALSDKGKALTLTWESVENAGGYVIYRKIGNGNWKLLAEVDSAASSYEDAKLKSGSKYTYTVVPIVREGEEIVYGRFYPAGISAKKK